MSIDRTVPVANANAKTNETSQPTDRPLVVVNRLYAIVARLSLMLHAKVPFVLKRGTDIFGASVALIALSPIILLTMALIKLEDGGPIFFSQKRVGKGGKLFKMFKFRSMRINAEQLKASLLAQNESVGVLFKMRRDPRVTRIGRFIRKLSIDELPQLINVLIGNMSLVGPRPALPHEVRRYGEGDRVRLDATPGITCIWQVSGRSHISFAGQVRLDVDYLRTSSFTRDLEILIKTVPAVVLAKGAF